MSFAAHKKFYLITVVFFLAGFTWLIYDSITAAPGVHTGAGVCLFRYVSGIPCPSCGATRSVKSILHGDFQNALFWNPLGFIVLSVMIVAPILFFYDLLFRKEILYNAYIKAEQLLKTKWVAVICILLIAANWMWSIYKGL